MLVLNPAESCRVMTFLVLRQLIRIGCLARQCCRRLKFRCASGSVFAQHRIAVTTTIAALLAEPRAPTLGGAGGSTSLAAAPASSSLERTGGDHPAA